MALARRQKGVFAGVLERDHGGGEDAVVFALLDGPAPRSAAA
jgi:hypothetical protein